MRVAPARLTAECLAFRLPVNVETIEWEGRCWNKNPLLVSLFLMIVSAGAAGVEPASSRLTAERTAFPV